jgi:hypothetical protein
MKVLPIIIMFVILLGNQKTQAQVQFNNAIDSNVMLIGDQRTIFLSVSATQPITIDSVDFKAWNEMGVEVIDQQSWPTNPERIINTQLKIGIFDTGYLKLPPLPLIYHSEDNLDTTYSNDLAIEVYGITLDSTGLAPIKDILKEPLRFRDFIPYLIALGVGCLIIIIVFLRKKRSKPEPVIVKIPDPPHEVALRALLHLREQKLWQEGKIKQYQSELTHIIRAYLEDRFQMPALESTTTEILVDLGSHNIEAHLCNDLDEILNMADLIKFAKAKPDVNIHSQFMDRAENFVRATQSIQKVIEMEEEE